MAQILVIRDGIVLATHKASQWEELAGKYPGAEVVEWHGAHISPLTPDPRTKEEKTEAYKALRRLAYPPVAEQLDMLYHDAVDGTTTWVGAIKAVKDKYPKPVSVE
jgi:hypothetical protein